jgi:hypothetical protein
MAALDAFRAAAAAATAAAFDKSLGLPGSVAVATGLAECASGAAVLLAWELAESKTLDRALMRASSVAERPASTCWCIAETRSAHHSHDGQPASPLSASRMDASKDWGSVAGELGRAGEAMRGPSNSTSARSRCCK